MLSIVANRHAANLIAERFRQEMVAIKRFVVWFAHVDLVMDVGAVDESRVSVSAVVEWLRFLSVFVVPLIDASSI